MKVGSWVGIGPAGGGIIDDPDWWTNVPQAAQRADELGLVGDVVPKEQLMPRAIELAQKIMENSPAALIASKRAIWESLNHGLDKALEHAWSVIREHGNHPDTREGPRAFAERRKPKWQRVTS